MIIYNVTTGVDISIATEWVQWMKHTHMPELLQTGLFTDFRLCKLLEQDETAGVTYVAQYYCDCMENYDTYITEHAPAMRAKVAEKYGEHVLAFRTLMEVL